MIEIEIVESPDNEIIGKHTFYRHELIFGRSRYSHLYINDKNLKKKHIQLEKKGDGLLCSNMDSKHYLSNGKKVSGKKLHKPNDQITIGDTILKIISIVEPPTEDISSLSDKYNKALENNPDLEPLFSEVENEIVAIEHEAHVKK